MGIEQAAEAGSRILGSLANGGGNLRRQVSVVLVGVVGQPVLDLAELVAEDVTGGMHGGPDCLLGSVRKLGTLLAQLISKTGH